MFQKSEYEGDFTSTNLPLPSLFNEEIFLIPWTILLQNIKLQLLEGLQAHKGTV